MLEYEVDEIVKNVPPDLMKKEFKYKSVTWKSDKSSSLEKEIAELKRCMEWPPTNSMETPTRWWNIFAHFVKHIDF